MGYTFLNLAEDTLKEAKTPLTVKEIWDKSKEYGFQSKLQTKGKTPWQTIASRLHTNTKKTDSIFLKVGSKFTLKEFVPNNTLKKNIQLPLTQNKRKKLSMKEIYIRYLLNMFMEILTFVVTQKPFITNRVANTLKEKINGCTQILLEYTFLLMTLKNLQGKS